MTDKTLKALDIAKIAGVSESEMKRMAEEYKTVIPSRILGRVKLYEQKAAGIVEKISSLEAAGKTSADIIKELGGKAAVKSTREKTEEKIRKERAAGGRGSKQTPAPENATPGSRAVPKGLSGGKADETAFLELKVKKLTNRVEQLESQLSAEREERKKEREELLITISKIIENIDTTGRWVDYFDKKLDESSALQDEFNTRTSEWINYTEEELDFLKRPFWNRRRK